MGPGGAAGSVSLNQPCWGGRARAAVLLHTEALRRRGSAGASAGPTDGVRVSGRPARAAASSLRPGAARHPRPRARLQDPQPAVGQVAAQAVLSQVPLEDIQAGGILASKPEGRKRRQEWSDESRKEAGCACAGGGGGARARLQAPQGAARAR